MTVKSDVSPEKSTTCGLGSPLYICCLFRAHMWKPWYERAGAVAEHVRRHVDPVRPDAELRVVVQGPRRGDRVEVPAAVDRVAGLRDGEALEGAGRVDDVAGAVELEGEVRDDPAVLVAVVEHDGIAEVVGVAEVPEVPLAHERVERERRDAVPVRLVVDADRDVDRLDVVVRADVAVGVRRVALAPVGEVEAGEVGVGGRSRRGEHLAPLDHLRQLRGGAGGILELLRGAAAGGSEARGRALRALLLGDDALQLADVEDLAVGRLQAQLTRVGALDRRGQVPADGRAVLERRRVLRAAGHRGLQRS